jgi:hypothetical protein
VNSQPHICKLIRESGRFIEYILQRPDVRDVWKSYTQHPFVQQLAWGTLPKELFKNYLVQDYLYLVSRPPCAEEEPHREADPLCKNKRVGSI